MNVYHITYFNEAKTACLYFYGCNFRCLGCVRKISRSDTHLPIISQNKPAKSAVSFLTPDRILNILKKQDVNKIIFMGGEPSIDPDFVLLTEKLKRKINARNVLLTNGYILRDLSFIDEVCVGIKAGNPRVHKEYTGKYPEKVFKNLALMNKENICLRTESVFIPGFIGVGETVLIAKAVSKINPDIPHRIDPYIPAPDTVWRKPYTGEIKEVILTAKKYLKKVTSIDFTKNHSCSAKKLF
jgi:pyruvate formate lyase activating enzyme